MSHHLRSDDAGGHFPEIVCGKFVNDLFHGILKLVEGDSPLFAGFDKSTEELFAFEGFPGDCRRALRQECRLSNLLIGREAMGAI